MEETFLTQEVGCFTLIEYGKAIVVKVSKENLKAYKLYGEFKDLNARWNPHLRCGQGWIFPGTKKKAVIDLISRLTGVEIYQHQEAKPEPAKKPKVSDYFN